MMFSDEQTCPVRTNRLLQHHFTRKCYGCQLGGLPESSRRAVAHRRRRPTKRKTMGGPNELFAEAAFAQTSCGAVLRQRHFHPHAHVPPPPKTQKQHLSLQIIWLKGSNSNHPEKTKNKQEKRLLAHPTWPTTQRRMC